LADNYKEAANAHFKKERSNLEGAQAMAHYETGARAVREKTARLKSLRLAKENEGAARREEDRQG
jgi:hypothetical protein